MSGEPRDPDWRLMSPEQLGEAYNALIGVYNATVAVNNAFAQYLDRSKVLSREDRLRMYAWNRDLCLLNARADDALDRGRPLVGPQAPQ